MLLLVWLFITSDPYWRLRSFGPEERVQLQFPRNFEIGVPQTNNRIRERSFRFPKETPQLLAELRSHATHDSKGFTMILKLEDGTEGYYDYDRRTAVFLEVSEEAVQWGVKGPMGL